MGEREASRPPSDNQHPAAKVAGTDTVVDTVAWHLVMVGDVVVDEGALKPGQRVRMVGTNSPSSFLVEAL